MTLVSRIPQLFRLLISHSGYYSPSKAGKTDVSTRFSIAYLEPGDTKILHLGPFKMREAGEHDLSMGINSQGNSTLENEISTGHEANTLFDRFVVYDPIAVQVIIAGIASIVLGAGIVSAKSYLKRRKAK